MALLTALSVVSGWACGNELEDWSARELRILSSLALNSETSAPTNPSNRFADNPEAAAFGKQLFFETRLSGTGDISCATCHDPNRRFTDGKMRSEGSKGVMRNSPTIVGAAFNAWFYWDGRRDSLWSQALVPFEAAEEMGGSRLAVLNLVASEPAYRQQYESLFGDLPPGLVAGAVPRTGGPFSAGRDRDAWYSIPVSQQRELNQAYANVGKAIAAYERTLAPAPGRFDRYVETVIGGRALSDKDRPSPSELAGIKLFIDDDRTQCLRCHNGPNFSNGGFHNIGSGTFRGSGLDFGREIGLRAVLMDEFNCLGPYSDARPDQCAELRFLNRDSHVPLVGAFKVPSLRGLTETAPYFHDGRFSTISGVLEHYNSPPSQEAVGPHELTPMNLTEAELRSLEAFLRMLSD